MYVSWVGPMKNGKYENFFQNINVSFLNGIFNQIEGVTKYLYSG